MGDKIRKRKNMSPVSVSCEQGNDLSSTKQSREFMHIYRKRFLHLKGVDSNNKKVNNNNNKNDHLVTTAQTS